MKKLIVKSLGCGTQRSEGAKENNIDGQIYGRFPGIDVKIVSVDIK